MKVLVLGTGGREHALAWRLAQDVGQSNVLLHPGMPAPRALDLQPSGQSLWTLPQTSSVPSDA